MQSRVWNYIDVSNSNYALIIVKDAICDAMHDRCKGFQLKPPVEGGANAGVSWFLSLYHDFVILYKDMSDVNLHKRGHKDVMHHANLNERIAITILTIASWNLVVVRFKKANQNSNFTIRLLFGSHVWTKYIFIEATFMATKTTPGVMQS